MGKILPCWGGFLLPSSFGLPLVYWKLRVPFYGQTISIPSVTFGWCGTVPCPLLIFPPCFFLPGSLTFSSSTSPHTHPRPGKFFQTPSPLSPVLCTRTPIHLLSIMLMFGTFLSPNVSHAYALPFHIFFSLNTSPFGPPDSRRWFCSHSKDAP